MSRPLHDRGLRACQRCLEEFSIEKSVCPACRFKNPTSGTLSPRREDPSNRDEDLVASPRSPPPAHILPSQSSSSSEVPLVLKSASVMHIQSPPNKRKVQEENTFTSPVFSRKMHDALASPEVAAIAPALGSPRAERHQNNVSTSSNRFENKVSSPPTSPRGVGPASPRRAASPLSSPLAHRKALDDERRREEERQKEEEAERELIKKKDKQKEDEENRRMLEKEVADRRAEEELMRVKQRMEREDAERRARIEGEEKKRAQQQMVVVDSDSSEEVVTAPPPLPPKPSSSIPKLNLSPRNNSSDSHQSPKKAEMVNAEVAVASPKDSAVSPRSPSSSPRKSPRSLKALFGRSPPTERLVLDGPLQQDLQQRQMIEDALKEKKSKKKKKGSSIKK